MPDDDRRYADDEMREIFASAAQPVELPRPVTAGGEGFTLAELQAIGEQVGLERARVAAAAVALDLRRGAAPRRTSLGLPVGVGRMVPLRRAPTDREWDRIVAELRATFDATGQDRSRGSLKQWANGNLQVNVEPADAGWRLRMRTVKSDAAALNASGVLGLVMGLALLLIALVAGKTLASAAAAALMPLLAGAAALGFNAWRLSSWADEREAQLEHVASHVTALLAAPPDDAA